MDHEQLPGPQQRPQLTVSLDAVEAVTPPETALSIVIAAGCTSGINGTFCGQIHFFASAEATEAWRKERGDITVLTLAEAYQLTKVIYIEPVLAPLA